MLRKNNYLNIAQLMDFALSKATELFPALEGEEPGSYEFERRVYSATFTFRHLVEAADSFHLLGPNNEFFEIDADIVLGDGQRLIDAADESSEYAISEANALQDSNKLREETKKISPEFHHVDMRFGVVTTMRCCKRRWQIWGSNKPQFGCPCFYLSRFNGFSILMSEDDVNAAWGIVASAHAEIRDSKKPMQSEDADSLDFALKCFMDAFPNGKSGATWREIQAKTGYSRRTINRALAKHGMN